MNWKSIRLELARTKDFPEGSASRALLLHLPLDEAGRIDEVTLRGAPARASVRRFWPNERDQTGYVVQTPGGWGLTYELREQEAEIVLHLETQPIRMDEYVTLTEPDGRRLPFRVASLKHLNQTHSQLD